ncbi:RNase H [Popillia japonica]|uniref:RNase H n=1 Tax=Popillia japonica TaxID=7064 RepID=A0AAW1MKV7_POPJA
MELAFFIYFPEAKNRLRKLEIVSLQGMGVISGVIRSSPTNAILALLGEPPLHIRVKLLARKFILKNLSIANNLVISSLESLVNARVQSNNQNNFLLVLLNAYNDCKRLLPQLSTSLINPYFYGEFELINFYMKIDYLEDWNRTINNIPFIGSQVINSSFHEIIQSNWSNHIIFFTVGSKSYDEEEAGFGVYCEQLDIQVAGALPSHASVFHCELTAIFVALRLIQKHFIKAVVIVCDSKSVLIALNSRSAKVCDSKSVLIALNSRSANLDNNLLWETRGVARDLECQGSKIQFVWSRSHRGITGNDKADWLAKSGRGMDVSEVKLHYRNFFSHNNLLWETRGVARDLECQGSKIQFV